MLSRAYPPEGKNIRQVYKLLTLSSENRLDSLFNTLGPEHPAKAPYSIFKQSSDTVCSGVIIGLGSRLQVFQNKLIRLITGHDEIDLELPGKEKCAYFCITSDQDSTFDFLSSLFLSFIFIKLVRYADKNCPGGKLPVPVHVLEEITVKADVKSASGTNGRENLSKCKVQDKYVGKATDIHRGTVFVRLAIGVNAIAHSCYDNRMPGKKDDVSFAVTHLDEEHGVAVGISGLSSRICKK